MSNVIHAKGGDFDKAVLKNKRPVLVDFWAPWCRPCIMMGPILDDLAGELKGKVDIVKVNIEEPENQELAQQFEIRSIPNMKLFKGGVSIHEFVGLIPKQLLKEEIEALLK